MVSVTDSHSLWTVRVCLTRKFNLGSDYTKEEFIDKFGYNSTYPQVVFEHRKIGGMKDTVRYLVDQNMVR